MNRVSSGHVFGVFSVIGGSISIWYSFQRQMCAMVGGGANSCSPNIVYLIPGVLAVLIGISLMGMLYWRSDLPNGE